MPTPALKRVNSISDIKKRAQSEERRLSDGGERTVVTVPVAIAPTVQAVVAALSEALGAAPPTPAPVQGVDRVVDTPAPSDDGRSDSGVSPFRPRVIIPSADRGRRRQQRRRQPVPPARHRTAGSRVPARRRRGNRHVAVSAAGFLVPPAGRGRAGGSRRRADADGGPP